MTGCHFILIFLYFGAELKMEWANAGDVLAVAGCVTTNRDFANVIQFYSEYGVLRYTVHVPYMQVSRCCFSFIRWS